jgi:hypothetical protein
MTSFNNIQSPAFEYISVPFKKFFFAKFFALIYVTVSGPRATATAHLFFFFLRDPNQVTSKPTVKRGWGLDERCLELLRDFRLRLLPLTLPSPDGCNLLYTIFNLSTDPHLAVDLRLSKSRQGVTY